MGEAYISNTDIMAVLYKIRFIIVDGRLGRAIEHESMVKDVHTEMRAEEILANMTLEQIENVEMIQNG